MKKIGKLLSLVLALAMVLALASCGGGGGGSAASAGSGSAAPAASSEAGGGQSGASGASGAQDGCNVDVSGVDLSGKNLGYVTITSTAPWGGRVGTEFKRMAEAAGANVKTLDANTVADDVTNYCRQMIDAGVDALAVFGGDPTAMVDIAKECKEAGIPLFLCALDVDEAGREYATACIGPDQEQAFVEIGKKIIEDNGADAGCNVVQISGVPFLKDYQLREAGFKTAMADSNYNLYEPDYAFSSRTDAKSAMEQHIQADGDKIKVYSFTGQNDAIQAVKDGKLEMTVMNRADDIAAETCVAMNEYFSTGSTEYYHYTDLIYITKDNVDQFIGKGEF